MRKLAIAVGLLGLSAVSGSTASPLDGGAVPSGLPLVPTRTIAFSTHEGTWLSVDVAPDGRDLVFDMLGDLYRVGIGGGRAAAITRGMAFDSQPVWSPKGDWLAFLSDRSGAENLWIMRPDGSDARRHSRA